MKYLPVYVATILTVAGIFLSSLVAQNIGGVTYPLGSGGGSSGIPQGGPLTQDLDFNGFAAENVGTMTAAYIVGISGGFTSLDGGNVTTDGDGNLSALTFNGDASSVVTTSASGGLETFLSGLLTGAVTVNTASFADAAVTDENGNALTGIFDGTGNLSVANISFSGEIITSVLGSSGNVVTSDSSTSGIAAFQPDGSLAPALTTGTGSLVQGISPTLGGTITVNGTIIGSANVTTQGNTLDNYGRIVPTSTSTIPTGSVVVVIGDSIQAGTGGGTMPAQLLSGLPAWANIAVYNFAVSGTTSGPTSATVNSGLAIMASSATGSFTYSKFLNGALSTTGTASIASLYPSSGNMYFYACYGANDIRNVNSMTYALFQTSMASIWTTAHGLGANVKVIDVTLLDQDNRQSGLAFQPILSIYNSWLRGQTKALQGAGAAFPDYLADANAFFTSMTNGSLTGDIWSSDGLHPQLIGEKMLAFIMNDAVVKQITYPAALGYTSRLNTACDFVPDNVGGAGNAGSVWMSASSTGNAGNLWTISSGSGSGGNVYTYANGSGDGGSVTTTASSTGAAGSLNLSSNDSGNGGSINLGSNSAGNGGSYFAFANGGNSGGMIDLRATTGVNGGSISLVAGNNSITTSEAAQHTITIPIGANDTFVTLAATQTLTNKSIAATQLTGTVATANLGSGTASSTTFLRGDQTYATPSTGTIVYAGNFSGAGTATTAFVVSIGHTMANTNYTAGVTPVNTLSSAVFNVTGKSTTQFTVTYLAGLTGTVSFDWTVAPYN